MAIGNKIGHGLASVGLLTDIDTVQQNILGLEIDDDQGNTYSYQQGVASLVSGDFVVINGDGTVSRTLNTPLSGPVAVCIGDGVAGDAGPTAAQFGWFQKRGTTPAYTNIATDASGNKKPLFQSATAGRATTTAAAGQAILGAYASGNPASNAGAASLARPIAAGFTLANA
jgi:hypothetical protein